MNFQLPELPGRWLIPPALLLMAMAAYSQWPAAPGTAANSTQAPPVQTPPTLPGHGIEPAPPQPVASQTRQTSPAPRPADPARPDKARRTPRPGEDDAGKRPLAVIQPETAAAYLALRNGQAGAALAQYQRALTHNPLDRDAMLGLASLARQAGQLEEASRRYEELLALDPQDAEAFAGLALIHAPGNPAHWETRLRQRSEALAHRSAALLHAWGSACAMQSHWHEAQAIFFRLVGLSPKQPEYLFNLAVSLDHLGKPEVASSFYRQAILLANSAAPGFDLEAAQARLERLEGARP